jgi:hypothetical protein
MVSESSTGTREGQRVSDLLAQALVLISCLALAPLAHAATPTISDIVSINVGGTAGTPAGTGYVSGVYGAVSPARTSSGYAYASINSVPVICRPVQGCTTGRVTLSLNGLTSNPGQSYLGALTPGQNVSGATLAGSSATYAYGDGGASWTWSGQTYTFTGSTATLSITHTSPPIGWLNLKYQVVGVTYAPPGPQSFVSYGDTLQVGSAVTNSSSFTTAISESISITAGADLGIFGAGSSVTASAGYTQEDDTSSSIALQTTSATTDKTPGAAPTSTNVDHDYDIIWVWLNPEVQLAVGTDAVGWTGYAYNTEDDAEDGMEVVALYVYYLKNPSMIETVDPSLWGRLQRAWDTSGLGALTSADFAAILTADPFAASSSYNPNTDTTHRFDEMTALGPINYEPPPPGGSPITETYTLSTQTTTTAGQGASYTYSVGFTIDAKTSLTVGIDLSADLKSSTMFTTTDKWSETLNSVTGKTAELSVTGPSGPITGPTEYQVWRDNVYGTFMFYPVPAE